VSEESEEDSINVFRNFISNLDLRSMAELELESSNARFASMSSDAAESLTAEEINSQAGKPITQGDLVDILIHDMATASTIDKLADMFSPKIIDEETLVAFSEIMTSLIDGVSVILGKHTSTNQIDVFIILAKAIFMLGCSTAILTTKDNLSGDDGEEVV